MASIIKKKGDNIPTNIPTIFQNSHQFLLLVSNSFKV